MKQHVEKEVLVRSANEFNTSTLLDMLDEQLDMLMASVLDLERIVDPILKQTKVEIDVTEEELSDWSSTQSVLNISLKHKLNMIDRLRSTILDISKRSML